jgi:hypothetical protein
MLLDWQRRQKALDVFALDQFEPRVYRRASASRVILIKSGSETSFEYEPSKPDKGFSPYRCSECIQYKVGHPLDITNLWLERCASVIIYGGSGFGSSH